MRIVDRAKCWGIPLVSMSLETSEHCGMSKVDQSTSLKGKSLICNDDRPDDRKRALSRKGVIVLKTVGTLKSMCIDASVLLGNVLMAGMNWGRPVR